MSWVATATAVSGGLGFASNFIGKKKGGGETISPEQLIPSWQQQTGKDLSAWVQKFLPNYTPGQAYGGQFTAGPTGQETAGLGILDKYLGSSGTGSLFGAGKNQILDTLSGKYSDAMTNPFIKSLTASSNMNLQDSINSARRTAGARGNYYSSSAIKNEDELRRRANTDLNTQVGGILQQERQNQFNAAPISQVLDQYENQTVPLNAVNASQTYGSLQRTIDQANLEAKYNDYINQRKELSALPGIAQGNYGTAGQYGIGSLTAPQTEQPSSLSNILSTISKLNFGALGGQGDIWSKLGGLMKG